MLYQNTFQLMRNLPWKNILFFSFYFFLDHYLSLRASKKMINKTNCLLTNKILFDLVRHGHWFIALVSGTWPLISNENKLHPNHRSMLVKKLANDVNPTCYLQVILDCKGMSGKQYGDQVNILECRHRICRWFRTSSNICKQ